MAERSAGIVRWRGLNTVDDPSVLEPGELVLCRNLVARSGALVRRPGVLRLASVATPRAWPPYVPPVDLPWVVQGDLWFRLEVPAAVVVGDVWTLRIQATNRAGAAATGFGEASRVGLTVEGSADGTAWTGFAHLATAEGGAVDVTTGWEGGVWEADVKVTADGGCEALRLTVTFDGAARDRETLDLAVLDAIEVQLPPEGVTPGEPFRVVCVARDADGLVLPFYSGRSAALTWDDGEGNALTVTDAGGTAFDERGWEDGIAEWQAVLDERGSAAALRVQVAAGGVTLGEDTTDIVERFALLWPGHAQAFQERTLEIRAFTAAMAARTAFDGTGYSLAVEGYDAATATWTAWDGLVTFPDAAAPDVTAAWTGGVWQAVLRFASAGEFSRVRLSLMRGDVAAATAEGVLHTVTSAVVRLPARVTAGVAFAVALTILDEEGVRVTGFDGTGLALAVTDENGAEVILVDAETGDTPDLTTGWDEGVWQGTVRFAAAPAGERLRLAAVWYGDEIGAGEAEIGEGAEGEVYGFQVWLPVGVAPGVPFEVMLVALDWWGGLVPDYAGEGLALVWTGLDAQTGEVRALAVSPADGESLTAGWDDGIWRGQFTMAAAAGCETLRLAAVLGEDERGRGEAPCALTFSLSAPTAVTEGTLVRLGIQAMQADGGAARSFAGADLELRVYRAAGGSWSGGDGLNVRVGWLGGWWAGDLSAGAAGQMRLQLVHEGEVEAEATITVEAALKPPDLPEPPDEDEGDTVRLTMTGPSRVWPGVRFDLGVRADRGGYQGKDAALTVTPGASPAPAIGSGWTSRVASSEWHWAGRMVGGHAGGKLRALLTWVPEYVPEDAEPEDFQQLVEAPIGQLVPVVTMPILVTVGKTFAMRVSMRADGAGGSTLVSYDGAEWGGYAVEVSADGKVWTAAPSGLLTGPDGGAVAGTGWTDGVIRPAAVVGADGAAYERLRVAASADGKRGPWAEAAIAAAAAGKLTVVLTVPDDLHAYGAAAAIRATVTEVDGSAAADPAERLTLSVEGLRDGSWYAFGALVDADTWQPLGLDRGWTANEWCLDALLAEAVPHTKARVRVFQDGMLRASAEIALRRDLAVTVTAPASAVVDREFALQMTVTDGSGGALPRFAAAAAAAALRVSVSYEDAPEGGAMLYDAASAAAPAWYSGWDEGAWDLSRAAVDAACTCTVAVLSRADSSVLGTAQITVLTVSAALLAAIRERQLAWGITAAWSAASPTDVARLIDVSGTTVYTVTQLRAYVNKITRSNSPENLGFVDPADNGWAGGMVAAPVILNTSSWVTDDNAGTVEALYGKVVSLRRTGTLSQTKWRTDLQSQVSYGEAGAYEPAYPSWDDALADCDEHWSDSIYTVTAQMGFGTTENGTFNTATVTLGRQVWRTSPSGLTTAVGKAVRVYRKFSSPSYRKFVPYAGEADEYVLEDTIALGAAAAAAGTMVGATGWTPSLEGLDKPAWGTNNTNYSCGDGGAAFLVDWSFSYT